MLPTFIVIGAMKCGTTSLYYYLDAHPEIGMSVQKETDYFLESRYERRDQKWYASRFRQQAPARGECSPNYTKRHLFSGVAERMNEVVPDVRLVYMVREPVERMISHYVSNRMRGRETRPFVDVATSSEENNYLLTSKYYFQLEPYLEQFGADQILVRSLEALHQRPGEILSDLHRFVGVEERGVEDVPESRFNTTSQKRVRGPVFRWLSSLVSQPVKDALRPYIPLNWIPGRSISRPDVSEELRATLLSYFREDVNGLRRLTGHSFNEWSM